VPILNQVVPASSAFHLSAYGITLIGKYLCYALLALAVDLIWGYCGILSLGHAAFFSLGGYAMGMYLMRQIGPRGVYGDPVLPDFMVFLNYKSLPWFWHGFNHFPFALADGGAGAGIAGAGVRVVCIPVARHRRVFSIITQALTYALMLAFFRNDMGFGGNNGFTDFKDILGFDLHSDRTHVVLLVITAAALAASYLACRMIVESRAGRVIRRSAMREPDPFSRLSRRILQAVALRVFSRSRRHRRRAVRAADRHHQSQRVFAHQFDRSRHLGGGGRAGHALRRGRGRGAGELRENLFHQRVS
jgi:urea transport system permease protein